MNAAAVNMNRVRDLTEYSNSTIVVKRSMGKWVDKFIKIIQAGQIDLHAEIIKLNFSVGYTNSIIKLMEARIAKEGLQIRIPDRVLELKGRKRVKKKRKSIYYEGVKKMILFVLKQISDIREYKLSSGDLVTRSRLEAYIMIVLVFLTALRSNEVTSLTIHDLYKIKVGLPVYIRIKKRRRPVIVGVIPDFYERIYDLIMFILAEGYDQIIPRGTLQVRFNSSRDKELFLLSPHESAISNNLVFTCHKSTLNKEIKEIFSKVNGVEHMNESVGVQGVRGLILTELINVGDPEIASLFTRHRNQSTTTTFYNNPNTSSAMDAISQRNIQT